MLAQHTDLLFSFDLPLGQGPFVHGVLFSSLSYVGVFVYLKTNYIQLEFIFSDAILIHFSA